MALFFVAATGFKAYAEQREFFCVANGVSETEESSPVTTETYQQAKDFVAPTLFREDSLTYDTLLERLQKQLKAEQPNAKRGRNGVSGCCYSKAFSYRLQV